MSSHQIPPADVREETAEQPRTSKYFCDAAADVTFQSSDGVLFRIYRTHLESTTGGFAPAGIPTLDEVVVLSEPEKVLELLFQFTHPSRQPSVLSLEFDLLFALAEAAEKYEVCGAMNVCNIRMHFLIDQKPMEILNYALKHDYVDLIDKAAPITVSVPSALTQASEILTYPGAIATWNKYYAQWDKLAKRSLNLLATYQHHYHSGSHTVPAETWTVMTSQHILKVDTNPRNFFISGTADSHRCTNCRSYLETMSRELTESQKLILKFTELM